MTALTPPYPNDQHNPASAIPVYVVAGPAPGEDGVTPVAGPVAVITTGGTAVTIATGPINGGYVINPYTVAGQNIAAVENLYINGVATPGSSDATANGTTSSLYPGSRFDFPASATGVVWKANAATSGHKFTVVLW